MTYDHRRFLKIYQPFIPGGFFPESLHVDNETITLEWIQKTKSGSIVFIMSEFCSACNFSAITDFVKKYPMFSYCLFVEGTEVFFNSIKHSSGVQNECVFIRCDVHYTKNILNYYGVPWAFAINSIGQIISGDVFNTVKTLEKISRPLINVYKNYEGIVYA